MKRDWRILAAALTVFGAAGCASPAATDETAATPARACINPMRIQKQTIVSDEEIRFELAGGEVWINTLKHSCNGLKSEGGFSWDVRGAQVCSNQQTIFVLNRGTPCLLGEFTRVTTPAAD